MHHITACCHVTLPTFAKSSLKSSFHTFLSDVFAAFAKSLSPKENKKETSILPRHDKSLADYNVYGRGNRRADAYITDISCLLLPFISIFYGSTAHLSSESLRQTVARCKVQRVPVFARERNVKRGGAVAQALWIDGACYGLHFCRVTQNPRKRYGGVCHVVFSASSSSFAFSFGYFSLPMKTPSKKPYWNGDHV